MKVVGVFLLKAMPYGILSSLGSLRRMEIRPRGIPGPVTVLPDRFQYSCSEQYGQNLGVFGRPLMFCPQ